MWPGKPETLLSGPLLRNTCNLCSPGLTHTGRVAVQRFYTRRAVRGPAWGAEASQELRVAGAAAGRRRPGARPFLERLPPKRWPRVPGPRTQRSGAAVPLPGRAWWRLQDGEVLSWHVVRIPSALSSCPRVS